MTDTDPRCAKCGHKRSKHHYRHPFVGPSVQTTIDAQDAKIKALVDALERIDDLTGHNMAMSARDEQCVNREARAAIAAAKDTT